MAYQDISSTADNDTQLLQSLQRSILDRSNQAGRVNTLFSDKPLQSTIDDYDNRNNNGGQGVTNYGALQAPISEIDDLALQQRGQLARIAGGERKKFEKALRLQEWNEDQSGRLRKLLDHNALRTSSLLRQSDAYPPGLKRVGTIKGLKYLLNKNKLDFEFPTNQLLYGDREGLLSYANNNAEGKTSLAVDSIHYMQKPSEDGDHRNDGPNNPIDGGPNYPYGNSDPNNGGDHPSELPLPDSPSDWYDNAIGNDVRDDNQDSFVDQDTAQRQFPLSTAELNEQFPIPPTNYNPITADSNEAGDQGLNTPADQNVAANFFANSRLDKYWSASNVEEIYSKFSVFSDTEWSGQFYDFVEWFVYPHAEFPTVNEVQIILRDVDNDGLQFGDVIVNAEPTRENIFEAFTKIVERTDLQLMPISKYMGHNLVNFETFITQHNLDNTRSFGSNETITEYTFCKYMITHFNRFYQNQSALEADLIFFRHPTLKTAIEETRNLVSADPTSALVDMFQAFKDVNRAGYETEAMQKARFDTNRWTITYNKLTEFEAVISERLNKIASLIFRNYSYRLIHEQFSKDRNTYIKILKKMTSKRNGAKFTNLILSRNNPAGFNEIITLAALYDCFVTSTSFPPSLNQLPQAMQNMISGKDVSEHFLAAAMLSLHSTENLFKASKLRNFALMYTAILAATYYFGFVDQETGDFESKTGNRPMVTIEVVLNGRLALDEFRNNLNPANLLRNDISLSYNALSDFILSLEKKAEFLADGEQLGLADAPHEGGEVQVMDLQADNTDLAAIESNQMSLNMNNINELNSEEVMQLGGAENAVVSINDIIPEYPFQSEDMAESEFSSHNSFTTITPMDNEQSTDLAQINSAGEFDNNFYDKKGKTIMTYNQQSDVTIEDVSDDSDQLAIKPTANQQEQKEERIVRFNLPTNISEQRLSLNTEAQNAGNTLNLHPSFADNHNNPAIENVDTRMAIEGTGGANRRTSDKHTKAIVKVGNRTISKFNNTLGKKFRRGRRARAIMNGTNTNQLAIINEAGNQEMMLTYNNVQSLPLPFTETTENREIIAYEPQNNQLNIHENNFGAHRAIDYIASQNQFYYNINYNTPQNIAMTNEQLQIEQPRQLQAIEPSRQNLAITPPRARKAITYPATSLTKRNRGKRSKKSRKIQGKLVDLYKKTTKEMHLQREPPIPVLKAIGAIPQPDIPAIKANPVQPPLAIQNTPHWDSRCLHTSAPNSAQMQINNNALTARNEQKAIQRQDLPQIKWLEETATPQVRSVMRRTYTPAVENSVVDNLNRQSVLIQKRPKYLAIKGSVADDDLRGAELLESIKVRRLAGSKRPRQAQMDYRGGKYRRYAPPLNYNPYNDFTTPIVNEGAQTNYNFSAPRRIIDVRNRPRNKMGRFEKMPTPAATSEVVEVAQWQPNIGPNRTQYEAKPTFETLERRHKTGVKRRSNKISDTNRGRARRSAKKSASKKKKKTNKYPTFDQIRHLYELDRSNRAVKTNKKKSNMIDLT